MIQRLTGLLTTVALVIALPAAAVEFQWDENPWPGPELPAGPTYTHTYSNIGNGDIVVRVEDANGAIVDSGAGALSPDSNLFLDPTGNGGEASFFVRADGNNGFVDIFFDFDELVGGRSSVFDLEFSIFDIDQGPPQWIDVVLVRGLLADGSGYTAPTSVTMPGASPTMTYTVLGGGTGGQLTGANGGAPSTGAGSDNGTAAIYFADEITELQIRYQNSGAGLGNQWISISNMTFIPEPNTATLFMLGLTALAAIQRRR